MPSILIVEDERSVRQALRFELEDEGYDIHLTSDFWEAISILKTMHIDVIISDIYISNGSGVQLMKYVQGMDNRIPFIMITAFPHSDSAMQMKNMLKDCFFEKPFVVPVLKTKISELLTSSSSKHAAIPQMAF